jgi:NADH:ubiquinone oxidoreductase subunit 4 (subunit M)
VPPFLNFWGEFFLITYLIKIFNYIVLLILLIIIIVSLYSLKFIILNIHGKSVTFVYTKLNIINLVDCFIIIVPNIMIWLYLSLIFNSDWNSV